MVTSSEDLVKFVGVLVLGDAFACIFVLFFVCFGFDDRTDCLDVDDVSDCYWP